jgi:endonuclease YncB( thermonuclease family)
MNKIVVSLMLALSFAGAAHAAQPQPPQTTPVVCVTDGCTSETQGQGQRR